MANGFVWKRCTPKPQWFIVIVPQMATIMGIIGYPISRHTHISLPAGTLW